MLHIAHKIFIHPSIESTEHGCEAGYTQFSGLIAHRICSAALSEKSKTLPSSCISLHELSILTFQRDALQNSMRG